MDYSFEIPSGESVKIEKVMFNFLSLNPSFALSHIEAYFRLQFVKFSWEALSLECSEVDFNPERRRICFY
jgi:hypothetical protein